MAKQCDFNAFLTDIEPSPSTVTYISSIQNNMRDYLKNHENYKSVHVDTFLSGSYAKHTAIRPVTGENKRDVDIIVVTSYDEATNSTAVLNEMKDILAEKEIYKVTTLQSHSVNVEMGGISVDVVPVIQDSEDSELYYIADKKTGAWIATDPKGHKAWSTVVNTDNNAKYKPLVKIFKWWRRKHCPADVKYPKGITLEKIIADNLGDSTLTMEEFLIETMKNIISAYKEEYVDEGINPTIEDPSEKIEGNNLLEGYSVDDFSEFVLKIEEHINMLNDEGVANSTWRKILGTEFPKDENETQFSIVKSTEKFMAAPHRQSPIWPMQRGGAAFISVRVTSPGGAEVEYTNNGIPLQKGCTLRFKAITTVKRPYKVVWQIVNTGKDAQDAKCLRGGFEESNIGWDIKEEGTLYTGSHSVQCFIVKNGVCRAKSKVLIVNVR